MMSQNEIDETCKTFNRKKCSDKVIMYEQPDSYFDHLKRFPYFPGYADGKKVMFDAFDEFIEICGCVDAIEHVIFEVFDDEMNQNGMEKAVNNIVSVLYLKKHNAMSIPICYDAYCDIQDLKTGEYNDLFEPEDLFLLQKDMEEVERFILEHPEVLE